MATLSIKRAVRMLPLIMLCICGKEVSAQQPLPAKHKELMEDQSFWNKDLRAIAQPRSNRDWIFMNTDFSADPLTFFSTYKTAFDLHGDDEMRLRKMNVDRMGVRHYKFNQYYKGIPVFHATMIVHQKADGRIYLVNGKMKRNLQKDATIIVTKEAALAIALRQIPAELGLWNFPDREDLLRKQTHTADTSYFPKAMLVWCNASSDKPLDEGDFHLGWKFDLWLKGDGSKTVIVDALNGSIIYSYNLAHNCSAGTVATPTGWYGTQNINTQFSNNKYYLIDDCNGNYEIHVYNYNIDGNSITDISRSNNTWNLSDGHAELAGATCLYGLDMTRDFYTNHFNRHSWDDDNSDVIAYVNAAVNTSGGPDPTNACFGCDGDKFTFGYGDNISIADDDWVAIDVVGHEFTHGVNKSEDAVQDGGEADGLNESFADIFGERVELYAFGYVDWVNGTPLGSGRKFFAPKYDTYGTPDFNNETDPHAVGSVQNYWFYLLHEGGVDTNYYGNITSVSGIGDDAIDICYQSITNYLVAGSEYIDARYGSIESAIDLFGSCSNQAVQVGKAWDAVNVGSLTDSYAENVCGTVVIGSYHAIHELSAASGCTNTVSLSASSVSYGAGKDVVFKPGFTCTGASNVAFTGYIEPCDWAIPEREADASPETNNLNEEEHAEQSAIVFYPNPADQFVTIQFTMKELPFTINIVDATGKIVQELSANDEDKVILNTKTFAPGLYVCVAKTGSGVFSKKFIVQH